MRTREEKFLFLASVFFVSLAGVAYELLAASALTILLGASIFYFSLTIGIYLAALGLGGWLSSKIENNLSEKLIIIGSFAAFLGGFLIFLFFGGFGFVFQKLDGSSANILKGLDFGFFAFNAFAFSAIFILGVLVGFILPLFLRILNKFEDLKNALGKVLFFDYAGAVFASVLVSIFLFPVIGLIKTSFLIGLIGITGIFAMVLFSYYSGDKTKKIIIALSVAVFILNFFGFVFGNKIEKFLEQAQFGENQLLFFHQSPYQRIDFVKNNEGKIKFFLNGHLQFESGLWSDAYHKTFAQPAMALKQNNENLKVLILGSGDGLLLKEILKYPKVESIVLVDIDKAVVEAAKNLNFMRELNNKSFFDERVEVINADAFKFVENSAKKFDIVFVGFPVPDDFNLLRLYSREFYFNLKKTLNDDGIGVIQSVGYLTPEQEMILNTVKAAGFFALPYQPSQNVYPGYKFGFTLISKKPLNPVDFAADFRIEEITLSADKINSIFKPIIDIDIKKTFRERFLNNYTMGELFKFNLIPIAEI
jgi:spermidine synthase